MAIFEIIEGQPGQGKSLYHARLCKKLLKRNINWFKKSGEVRRIYSNIKFSESFEKSATFQDINFLEYWSSTEDIIKLYDVDLLWDEIATELDSRSFASLSDDLKRFLSQYRKRGVDIYANTQDFSMIDMRARLMTTKVATLYKLIGSRDPSPTKPPVKRIWGIVLIREFDMIITDNPHDKKYKFFPEFFFIDREDIEIYDTRQDIQISSPIPRKRRAREVHFIGGEKDGQKVIEYTK